MGGARCVRLAGSAGFRGRRDRPRAAEDCAQLLRPAALLLGVHRLEVTHPRGAVAEVAELPRGVEEPHIHPPHRLLGPEAGVGRRRFVVGEPGEPADRALRDPLVLAEQFVAERERRAHRAVAAEDRAVAADRALADAQERRGLADGKSFELQVLDARRAERWRQVARLERALVQPLHDLGHGQLVETGPARRQRRRAPRSHAARTDTHAARSFIHPRCH